ncbi:MAG: hypothetical protein AAB393_16445, partial [Bacteroidota bacterium]
MSVLPHTSLAVAASALLLSLSPSVLAQRSIPPPKREVRAVWLTTAASLDWPKSMNIAEQQASLKKIVADVKAAHFNTILFQARARGDAY